MEKPSPPRRKVPTWLLWLLVVALVVGGFLFQLVGPDPPIVVSRATTFLTEPLGEDGLPDYEAHLLQQGQAGVTPENNAAVLIWQALWPGELNPEHQPLLSRAIGLKKLPSASATLTPTDDSDLVASVSRDLSARFGVQLAEDEPAEFGTAPPSDSVEDWANELIERAQSYVWTAEQLPALAAWAEQNQAPLDLLVEASGRSHYWSPSPSWLDGSHDMLFAALLPGVQEIREAARGLCMRAMGHVGAGRLEEAWIDLLACHRLARHVGQPSDWLVGQLVAAAMENMACRADMVLLSDDELSSGLARKILADLRQLPPATDIVRSVDQGERLSYLDFILCLADGQIGRDEFSGVDGGDELAALKWGRVDWNVALREGNRWYDRLTTAIRQPTFVNRQAAFSQLDAEIRARSTKINKKNVFYSIFSPQQRSELVSTMMGSLLLPALGSASHAEDRVNVRLELTRVAAALAVYRAERKEYPEQLEALVPELLPQLPIDLFSEKPFLYQRKEDGGYLLYSVGVNSTDDGGSDLGGEIVEGEWRTDGQATWADQETSDEVIRMPVPPLRMPASLDKAPRP